MANDISDSLVELGFTSTEARVYCAMVPEEQMNGYQIAKVLNLSRSSVYAALENLLEKGAILSVPGDTNSYVALDPDNLIEKFVNRYEKNAESCRRSLATLSVKKRATNLFCNIQGKSNLIEEARQMIRRAEKEIVMTTSFPIEFFYEDLSAAINRGVRVIMFSFLKMNLMGLNIEFYGGEFDLPPIECPDQRLLLVVDIKNTLIGSNDKNAYFTLKEMASETGPSFSSDEKAYCGMKSTNRLMVNLILEHIHHDIYLQKLKQKAGKEIITPDIQIGSGMEIGKL